MIDIRFVPDFNRVRALRCGRRHRLRVLVEVAVVADRAAVADDAEQNAEAVGVRLVDRAAVILKGLRLPLDPGHPGVVHLIDGVRAEAVDVTAVLEAASGASIRPPAR